MSEVPKRLAPKGNVLRELYLKSGNRCAFPQCPQLIIDTDGNFIAQICHIESANEGGERFNSNSNNEDRRAFDNLILLCYPHHVVTNDVDKYRVTDLREMKKSHEKKFSDIVSKIRSSIQDHTNESEISLPISLSRMNSVLKWDLASEELKENISLINQFAENVQMLPIPTRELFAIAIKRGTPFGSERRHLEVPAAELMHACDLSEEQMREQVAILTNRDVAWIEQDWELERDEVLYIREMLEGWSFAEDLQQFCKLSGVAIEQIIVDLRFDQLD